MGPDDREGLKKQSQRKRLQFLGHLKSEPARAQVEQLASDAGTSYQEYIDRMESLPAAGLEDLISEAQNEPDGVSTEKLAYKTFPVLGQCFPAPNSIRETKLIQTSPTCWR